MGGDLSVKIISEGVHSGDSSGIVSGSFRILRSLLSRFEDEKTGEILVDEFKATLSDQRLSQVKYAAEVLGKEQVADIFPFVEGAQAVCDDTLQLLLNRQWSPQLVITGQKGIRPCETAGNTLRPETALTLSLRLPPIVDAKVAGQVLTDKLLENPPYAYGAQVKFTAEKASNGWAAPEVADWLVKTLENSFQTVFSKPCNYQGCGGSIPFMGMLGKMFPKAQFCVTGVLGPASNAHVPNEFLHIGFSAKLKTCVALIVSDHCSAKVETLN